MEERNEDEEGTKEGRKEGTMEERKEGTMEERKEIEDEGRSFSNRVDSLILFREMYFGECLYRSKKLSSTIFNIIKVTSGTANTYLIMSPSQQHPRRNINNNLTKVDQISDKHHPKSTKHRQYIDQTLTQHRPEI